MERLEAIWDLESIFPFGGQWGFESVGSDWQPWAWRLG